MDNPHDAVIDRRGESYFAAVGADGAVDGVHLGPFPLLQILQHAGLEARVLADGDGDDKTGNGLLDRAVVVQQFHDILPLHRLDADAAGGADVDAFLEGYEQGMFVTDINDPKFTDDESYK